MKETIKLGCINVNGFGLGKMEDMNVVMHEGKFDIVGVTETHLRENIPIIDEKYKMFVKGRSKWGKKGGGIGLIVRKDAGYEIEEFDVGKNEKNEDIMAVRIEYKIREGKDSIIVIVCYMTTEGRDAAVDNRVKYDAIRKVIRENVNEKVIVMGDMNGHIGILGEVVNSNGQMLLDFTEENDLENLNITIGEGQVTWNAREARSAIDYVLVNSRARECISRMWIDEDGEYDITTDHNMLVVEYRSEKKQKDVVVKKKRKWRIKDANWDDFQVDLGTNEIDIGRE